MTRGADTLQYKPTNNTKPRAADTQRVGAHRFRKLHGGTRKTFATMKLAINNLAALAALGLLSFASAADAQITTYSTATAFAAATTGITSFNFNGYGESGFYKDYSSTGLTVQGVKFTVPINTYLYVQDPTYNGSRPFGNDFYLEQQNTGPVNVALPAGTTAFGANFSGAVADNAKVTINGTPYTFAEPGSKSNTFFGFTSTTPITSLTYTSNGFGTSIDNVRFGSIGVAATPEPGSIALLIGMGVTGAGVLRRRRK